MDNRPIRLPQSGSTHGEHLAARVVLRGRHLLVLDAVACCASFGASFAVRFDAPSPAFDLFFTAYAWVIPLLLVCRIGSFIWFRLYQRVWRWASVDELIAVVSAVVASSVLGYSVVFAVAFLVPNSLGFPRTVPLIDTVLMIGLAGAWRFALRVAGATRAHARKRGDRTLVIGAGAATMAVIRELRFSGEAGLQAVGILSDDLQRGQRVLGVPVIGRSADLAAVLQSEAASVVVFALPTAEGRTMRELVGVAEAAGARCLTVPSMTEVLAGRVTFNAMREVQVEDLLRRAPARVDLDSVRELFRESCVLITGAGGSIGGELARQLYALGARKLVLLGRGENSIFETLQSLGTNVKRPGRPEVIPVICDIRDRGRLGLFFEEHQPDVVFHAAAHKHVPLMEMFPEEAVTTNVMGTLNVLDSCVRHDLKRLVFISTDKAVRPSSVLGATKRIGELLIADTASRTGRNYVSVRFGNVLSSRGSVLPLFRRQLQRGEPLTVTHPDAMRYFMTIPEAIQLVLQAAVLARPGASFVLDMGEPVRIVELAQDLIRLSGMEPGRDVEITFTGRRPGEKLAEQLVLEAERTSLTSHEAIRQINATTSPSFDLRDGLLDLAAHAQRGDKLAVLAALQRLVPEYEPSSSSRTEVPHQDAPDNTRVN